MFRNPPIEYSLHKTPKIEKLNPTPTYKNYTLRSLVSPRLVPVPVAPPGRFDLNEIPSQVATKGNKTIWVRSQSQHIARLF